MINHSLNSLQRSFDQLAQGVNDYTKLEYFNDGADVFGATPFRCIPQFFFYLHLPNQWHDNAGGGWAEIEGVNLGGPILAFSIISYILGAGYYFMKCEETRHVKSMLTDEILLSYYALKKEAQGEQEIQTKFAETFRKMDALIKEQIDRDKRILFGYWFYRLCGWKYEGYEELRIKRLKEFAETQAHLEFIHRIQTDDTAQGDSSGSAASTASPKSGLRNAWEKTYETVVYYSYAHWILWMISTIVLYQTTEGYGINEADPAHSDAPGFFTDNATGFSHYDAALIFQTVVPLIFALVVVWRKTVTVQAADTSIADEKQRQIRAYYLEKTAADGSGLVDQTHRHFHLSQALTAFTTFIGTFIVTNVAAWPVQGFVTKVCNYKTEDSTYIPTIFAFTVAAALIQAGLKVYDMRREEKQYFGTQGQITIKTASQKPSLWQFYTSHEHSHKAWYNGPGLMFGSVGLLLTRILLNGGMGNFRVDGVQKMERSEILFIGLGMTAVMMILRTAQYYALTQRNEVLKAAGDQKPRMGA
ncbi:MAG: hypothetical protein ACHQAX_05225 [Gammaproteobacteria bacterium]